MNRDCMDSEIDFEVKAVTDCEIEKAFSVVSEMDWNLTLSKFKKVHAEFARSVYIAVTANGMVIGTLSVIPSHYGESILGNLVVSEKYRKKGVGSSMLKRIIKMYEKCVIRFTAVPGTSAFYRSLGFTDVGPTHDIFYIKVDLSDLEKYYLPENDFTIKNFSPEMFEALCRYDESIRGYDMSKYLSVMVATTDQFLAVCFNSNGCIIGYTSFFQKSKGSVVKCTMDGLYAENDDVAFVLYRHALQTLPNKTVVKLQTVRPRLFLTTFGKYDPSDVHQYTTMANGNISSISLDKLYCVTDSDYSV